MPAGGTGGHILPVPASGLAQLSGAVHTPTGVIFGRPSVGHDAWG